MESSIKINYEELRSIDFASIGAAYTPVGGKLSNYVVMLEIFNLTDADLLLSFDGTRDNTIIPAKTSAVKDYATNKINSDSLGLAAGNYVQAKYITGAPTFGKLYIATLYAGG